MIIAFKADVNSLCSLYWYKLQSTYFAIFQPFKKGKTEGNLAAAKFSKFTEVILNNPIHNKKIVMDPFKQWAKKVKI